MENTSTTKPDRNLYINDLGIFDSPFEYKVMYSDDNVMVSAELGEFAFVHLQMDRFTKSLYKHYLKVWEDVKDMLRDMNYTEVFCMIPTQYNLEGKVSRLFGWKKIDGDELLSLFVVDL